MYNLALGGILTSVVVPLLINAAKRDTDRGEAYDQRIFTLGVLALGASRWSRRRWPRRSPTCTRGNIGNADAQHLTVIFAYFFIPQIFFYGVSSLAGAILNARGKFARADVDPCDQQRGRDRGRRGVHGDRGAEPHAIRYLRGEIQLLGIGTTLGIVLQTAALIPRCAGSGSAGGPARLPARRGGGDRPDERLDVRVRAHHPDRVPGDDPGREPGGLRGSQQAAGAGFAAYSNAYLLFQLPYAIVGISVITALLPRMSAHAAERRYQLVATDFSTATRLASVIVVPAALVLAVLGAPLAEGVFGYGSTSAASARYLGEIFAVFSLGLLPYMLFQLLLRVFYAMHDSRTPALIGVVTMVINITANLIALAVLPPKHVVAGLGAGFGIANLVGTVVAWRVLSHRIGGLGGRQIRSSLLRMHAAAIPGVIFAIAVSVMIGAVSSGGRSPPCSPSRSAAAAAMLLYVMFAKAFGVRELTNLTDTVRARLR